MKQHESIEETVKTVVFRKNKGDGMIIALLPLIPSAIKSGECYAFKDQEQLTSCWGSVPYEDAIDQTVPAVEHEYAVLRHTISALGHQLIIKTHEELEREQNVGFETRQVGARGSYSRKS